MYKVKKKQSESMEEMSEEKAFSILNDLSYTERVTKEEKKALSIAMHLMACLDLLKERIKKRKKNERFNL